MMTWMEINPSPIALRELLKAHRLFPDALEDPIALIRYSNITRVGYAGTAEEPAVVLLESPLEEKTALVQVVLRAKTMFEDPECLDLAHELASRWFVEEGLRRVEARIECSRTPTLRFLKALGFHQETGPSGIRQAFTMGGEPICIHVMGLLQEDKPRFRLNHREKAFTMEKGEVSHAV